MITIVNRFSQFLLSPHFTLGLMVASFFAVGVILFTTSPIKLGPAGMLLAFAVFYVWFFALFLGVVHVARAFRRKPDDPGEKYRILSGRAATLAASWAFAPLILLALQSIEQLYLASAALVVAFEVLASVYILRR